MPQIYSYSAEIGKETIPVVTVKKQPMLGAKLFIFAKNFLL